MERRTTGFSAPTFSYPHNRPMLGALNITFFDTCIAIGSAQVADCLYYLARRGKVGFGGFTFSVVEWVFGALCVWVIWRSGASLEIALAWLYVAYLIAWTAYGFKLVARVRATGDTALTPAEAIAGGVFGLVFTCAALAAMLLR
jgi:hypothetical protein